MARSMRRVCMLLVLRAESEHVCQRAQNLIACVGVRFAQSILRPLAVVHVHRLLDQKEATSLRHLSAMVVDCESLYLFIQHEAYKIASFTVPRTLRARLRC